MKKSILNQTFDEERSLYNIKDTEVLNCKFEGPADGESVLKEGRNYIVKNCSFSLRYPMWHAKKFCLKSSSLDEKTRAPLWYCTNGTLADCNITGIKCLRECKNIKADNCNIASAEFGWRCKNLKISNSTIDSMYFLFETNNVEIKNLNFGGGLGIDYQNPDSHAIADFADYFAVFAANIKVAGNPAIHFEPGRSVVAQCGSLVSRVLYVKEGEVKKFAILDAGFSDLIRPAMYDAYHFMENISSCEAEDKYDVVGPICESSDVFGKDVVLNGTSRGDFVAIRSAGAYGEVMASQYNLRELPKAYFSEDLNA